MILGWSPSRIVSGISDLWPRWPPQRSEEPMLLTITGECFPGLCCMLLLAMLLTITGECFPGLCCMLLLAMLLTITGECFPGAVLYSAVDHYWWMFPGAVLYAAVSYAVDHYWWLFPGAAVCVAGTYIVDHHCLRFTVASNVLILAGEWIVMLWVAILPLLYSLAFYSQSHLFIYKSVICLK